MVWAANDARTRQTSRDVEPHGSNDARNHQTFEPHGGTFDSINQILDEIEKDLKPSQDNQDNQSRRVRFWAWLNGNPEEAVFRSLHEARARILSIMDVPVGALTAIVGVLALQSHSFPADPAAGWAELLTWAVVFGAAQQAITRFIDKRVEGIVGEPRQDGDNSSSRGSSDPLRDLGPEGTM